METSPASRLRRIIIIGLSMLALAAPHTAVATTSLPTLATGDEGTATALPLMMVPPCDGGRRLNHEDNNEVIIAAARDSCSNKIRLLPFSTWMTTATMFAHYFNCQRSEHNDVWACQLQPTYEAKCHTAAAADGGAGAHRSNHQASLIPAAMHDLCEGFSMVAAQQLPHQVVGGGHHPNSPQHQRCTNLVFTITMITVHVAALLVLLLLGVWCFYASSSHQHQTLTPLLPTTVKEQRRLLVRFCSLLTFMKALVWLAILVAIGYSLMTTILMFRMTECYEATSTASYIIIANLLEFFVLIVIGMWEVRRVIQLRRAAAGYTSTSKQYETEGGIL